MVIAYVSGEIAFNPQPRDNKTFLEFLKLFDGVHTALTISDSRTSIISFLCSSEDSNLEKAQETAERKFNKFYEFVKVVMPYRIHIRTELIRGNYNSGDSNVSYNKFPTLLDTITNDEFERYLIDEDNLESRLLIEAIEDYDDEKFFDAFSKLVNYTSNMPAGQRFKDLRASLSHEVVTTAKNNVQRDFPNEFDFIGNRFDRNSSKNVTNLKNYWPIILLDAQTKFRSMVKNS